MIPKYRNKAIVKTISSFVIVFFGFIMFGATAKGDLEQFGQFVFVVSNIIGGLLCALGCADLLKAKGYESSLLLVFLIAGLFCSCIFILVAPLVIIFGLEDKTKEHSQR